MGSIGSGASPPAAGSFSSFLRTHPAFVNTRRVGGRTLLHHAASQGRVDWAAALIELGADVNVCDDDGWTPLFHAFASGQTQMVRFLLHHHALV